MKLPAIAALLCGVAGLRPCAAQVPEQPFALQKIDLTITLDYQEGTLAGNGMLRLQNYTSQPVQTVPIELGRLFQASDVLANGKSVRFTQDVVRYGDWPSRQMNQLLLELPEAVPANGVVDVAMKWQGYLVPYTETGMLYVREKIDSAFTILRAETGAFPVPAIASHAGNRAAQSSDFAYDVRITVPSYEVVSLGGTLVARDSSAGNTTYHFRSSGAAPFLNISIAPYRVIAGSGLRIAYFPEDSSGAVALAAATRAALDSLTRWFGPMGDTIPVSVAEIPPGFGSQASVRAGIIQQASAFRNKASLGELYHELSHIWNPPSLDRPDPRWNEGLAMFVEYLLAQRLDGARSVDSVAQRYVPRVLANFARDSANRHLAFADYGRANRTNFSYDVGFLMFDALYQTVGPAEFERLMGGVYQQYRLTGLSGREFVAYLTRQSRFKLAPFFADWFWTAGWYDRLQGGETLTQMADRYRKGRG